MADDETATVSAEGTGVGSHRRTVRPAHESVPGALLSPRVLTGAAAVLLVALAIAMRASVWDFVSDDIRYFFEPWRRTIEEIGVSAALSRTFTDYTPPYLYLLAASTAAPLDAVHAVKLIAAVAELALLITAGIYLHKVVVAPRQRKLVGAFALLVGPTVLLNSALWGQVDAAWVAPVIGALVLTSRKQGWGAMALLGLGLSIKLQVVFVLPAFAYLVLRRILPLGSLAALPVGYVAGFLPAILLGLPVGSLFSIYAGQTSTYPALTLNAPNLYQLFPAGAEVLSPVATLMAAALCVLLLAWLGQRTFVATSTSILAVVLLFALLLPFVLPHMHERYFFAADVLSLLYAVARPGRWWIPLAVTTASLLSYLPYLFKGDAPVPFPVLSLLMASALLAVLRDVVRDHRLDEAPSVAPERPREVPRGEPDTATVA